MVGSKAGEGGSWMSSTASLSPSSLTPSITGRSSSTSTFSRCVWVKSLCSLMAKRNEGGVAADHLRYVCS